MSGMNDFNLTSIDEVIKTLEGTRCGFKNTSCPDQLAQALKYYKEQNS